MPHNGRLMEAINMQVAIHVLASLPCVPQACACCLQMAGSMPDLPIVVRLTHCGEFGAAVVTFVPEVHLPISQSAGVGTLRLSIAIDRAFCGGCNASANSRSNSLCCILSSRLRCATDCMRCTKHACDGAIC